MVGFDPVATQAESEPVIRLRDVSKSYGLGRSRTPVLRAVSFAVERGELLALVGQSGSGKSTLLNIVGGLDLPDSGHVEVLGHDLGQISDRALARLRNRDIGFVFQAFHLLDHLTCLGNVMLPAAFSRGQGRAEERAMESLRRVGMADLAGRRPGELSGGQKQRVAIARALFSSPAVLLCDEPTGNLDSKTGREVIELFAEINREDNVTMILVTHERRVSQAATRVLTMRDGELVDNVDVGALEESHGDDSAAAADAADNDGGGEDVHLRARLASHGGPH